MALDEFFKYVRENTAKPSSIPQREIARNLWNGFNNNPKNTATKNSVVNMMTNSPVVGDLLSGLIGASQIGKGLANDIQSLKQPTAQGMVHQMAAGTDDYVSGGAGLAAMIPGLSTGLIAGMMKNSGKVDDVLKKTKYEIAHEDARKRAVQMLGLPESNTAMDRAKALGYRLDMPLFHGTAADIDRFKFFEDPNKRVSGSPVGKLGVSLAIDPALANEFASRAGSKGANVLPLLHRADQGASVHLSGQESNDQVWATVLDAWKQGFDSLKFNNYTSNGLKNQSFILARHPKNIRSIFAAFDPSKLDSSDILAGVGGASLAGLLGSAYSENFEDRYM